MSFADIQTLWHSPQNRPDRAELEEMKTQFVAEIRRRHRGNTLLLCLVFALLLFFTGKVVLHALWPAPSTEPIDFSREWGVIPFFALPWLGLIVMLYLHRSHRSRHSDYAQSISASLGALLDENRMERLRYKVIGVLLVVSALVLPLIVAQLRAVGKAGDEILVPAFVVYPAYVVGTITWATFYYRRKLLKRKQQLEALLSSYAERSL